MRFQVIEFSSSLDDTPENMFIMDRLCGFCHGFHGDIELYNDPMLLAQREIEQRIEDAILYGTGTTPEGFTNVPSSQ